MPLAFTIDPDNRVVIITGDYADASAWRALLGALVNDPRYQRGSSFIRDVRDSLNPVDVATVMGIITVVKEYWGVLGAHRAAILMSPRDDGPALVAHALADHQHLPIRAFTSYQEAMDWLLGT